MAKHVPVWLFGLFFLVGCTSPEVYTPVPPIANQSIPASTNLANETGTASTPFSYPALIARALAASPDYAATLASARAEYYRYKARTDWRDPEANARYMDRRSDNFEHERDILGNTFSESGEGSRREYGPSLNVYFSNPFENRHVLRAGRAAQREKEADAALLQNELSSVIYELFIQALYEAKSVALLREREALLLKWRDHLDARRHANVATQAEKLALDLQLLRLQANLSQKMITVQSAQRSLAVLAHLPPMDPITLEPSLPDWPTIAERLSANTLLFDAACANSPDLAATQAAYEKARAEHNAARARQIPWFTSAQAGYGWLDNDARTRHSDGEYTRSGADSDEWEVRLSMTIPVFAWMSSEIKEAEANMRAAQLKNTAIRQRIHHELTGYLMDLKSVVMQKTVYQQQLAKLQRPDESNTPDRETFYKLSDAYLAAEEQAFLLDMQCALLYGKIMCTLSTWAPETAKP